MQQRALKTKGKILATAVRLFARDGFQGTRIDDLASTAKVNRQRIYAYFGNKEKLFEAAMLEVFAKANAEDDKLLALSEKELPELTAKLTSPNRHITIETAGIVFVPNLKCQLMSISPKLSSSVPDDPQLAEMHEKLRLNIPAIRDLMACYEYQLKFVVDRQSDLDEIKSILAQLPRAPLSKVMLMPQARTRDELQKNSPFVAEMCKNAGYTFSHRMQVLLWNGQRGK